MTPNWRKSSRSGSDAGTSDCVEVAHLAGDIGVRDSKNAEGPHLVLDAADWRTFTHNLKHGHHDLP